MSDVWGMKLDMGTLSGASEAPTLNYHNPLALVELAWNGPGASHFDRHRLNRKGLQIHYLVCQSTTETSQRLSLRHQHGCSGRDANTALHHL